MAPDTASIIRFLAALAEKQRHFHFWQQDWTKHRKRAWKRARSAGFGQQPRAAR